MGNRPWGEMASAGRNVHGATSPDTPQRRNSVVKHVFRHDKSSFAGERRLSPSFGYLHGPTINNSFCCSLNKIQIPQTKIEYRMQLKYDLNAANF